MKRFTNALVLGSTVFVLGMLLTGCQGDGTLVPMADAITYMSYGGTNNDFVWVHWMLPDGSNKRIIVDPSEDTTGTMQGVLSPDGAKILYIDNNFDHIKTYDIATGTVSILYTGTYVITVKYNPGGTKIVFTDDNASRNQTIYSIDAAGGDRTPLADPPLGINYLLPSFNRTGTKIVFQQGFSDVEVNVAIMDANGSNMTMLTDDDQSYHPSFLSDGRIIYRGWDADTSSFDLWVMDADGGNKTNLTNTAGVNESFPSGNSGGTLIAYSDGTDIFVAPFDGITLGTPVNTTDDVVRRCWRPSFGRVQAILMLSL